MKRDQQLAAGTAAPPCWAVWSWRQWKRNGRQHYAHAMIEGRRKTLCGVPVYRWWELGDPASARTIHCAECRSKLPNKDSSSP